jgi:hypothetical protein
MTGFSMGGTAGNTVGIRHGDIFAGVSADKGICNWLRTRMSKTHAGWQRSVHPLWGKPGDHLKTIDGQDMYEEWMNIPKWLREHPEAEIPFMEIKYGRYDGSIAFEGTPEYFRALQEGRHPFTGGWMVVGHFPASGTGSKNGATSQPRNESLPAFSWATCNTPLDEEPVDPSNPIRYKGNGQIIDGKTMKATVDGKRFKGFDKDCTGMYLMMNGYGYSAGGPNFKVISNTNDTLTVEPNPDFGDLKTAPLMKPAKDGNVGFALGTSRLTGVINSRLEWSSSSNNFDKKSKDDDIVDTPDRYEISIRLAMHTERNKALEYRPNDPEATCTVDVTPRRLQQFKVKPGDKVTWKNMDCSDPKAPKEIASGTVEVDKYGLITVKKFKVCKKGYGNRLIIVKQ